MDLNYLAAVIDEIALEGLDGITINTLWTRLETRPGFMINLDEKSKPFLWRQITTVKDFEYYELPEPRPVVDVFKRMDFVDPESGHMVELNKDLQPADIYPINYINQDGVVGSCSTYFTRRQVTSELVSNGKAVLKLDEVTNKFGDKLVIVASQRQRNEALVGKTFDPAYVWVDVTFCILERIGRSRYNGELSAGPVSLEVFKMPSKTLFYHTLKLVNLGILKKQDINVLTKSHKHQLRKIFHLTRFFKVVNSKNFVIATQIATYLLEKPNHREVISKTRSDLHIEEKSFKKVYKTYKKIFKTYLIPYRDVFPDAKERDYMTKSKIAEKHLRVIECSRMPTSARDEETEDDDEEEEGESEETSRDLKPYSYIYERPLLYQALIAVESAGPQGVNRTELTKMMAIDYYDGRSICKSLVKSGCVVDVVVDEGKTKRIQYIATKFKEESEVLKEYYSEQGRFLELIKTEPGDDLGDSRTDIELDETSQDETLSQSTLMEVEMDVPVIKLETPDEFPKETISDQVPVQEQEVTLPDEASEDASMEEDLSKSFNTSLKRVKKESVMTGKHFKRLSWLLEAIRDAKLVENIFYLIKNLRAKEKAEGSAFMIDKKSLMKLMNMLVKEGKVRCIKTIIGSGDNTKLLQFYCDPSIQPTDGIVKSAIEQAKLKSFSVSKESLKNSHKKKPPGNKKPCKDLLKGLPESARESIYKLHEFRSKLKSTDMVYDKKAARLYGNKPKMQRARIIHQLLWYLVYGYQGKVPEEPTDTTTQQSGGDIVETTTKDKPDSPPVYVDEMNWKRYLAPLPEHRGYPAGWCLIGDVLLSLPLCLFCALVHVSYKINGLLEWLNDPVKCLYPISFLPSKISQQLLFARKYIFTFHENCVRMCHMGLLSFGSSNNKEKDQIFIYLHQFASLVDTTASLEGYYKTRFPPGHEPEMKTYHFDSMEALDQYWIDLKHFALSSNLGHKNLTENDKEDIIEEETIYLSLESAQSPKTPDTVIDDGIIPGDGKGPAGLDSYLYCHLHRNWSWGNIQHKPKTSAFTDSLHGIEESKRTESDKAIALFEERKQMTISSSPTRSKRQPRERITLIGGKKGQAAEVVQVQVAKTKGNKGGKGIKRKTSADHKRPSKKKLVNKMTIPKKSGKKKGHRWQDVHDRTALEAKTGMRVQWSSKEDGLLLTCKIASLVMDKNSRGMLIPWVIVRDVLHKYAPDEAVDKSSLACQRRVAHSLKNTIVKQNLSVFYAEAIQDPKIKRYMNAKYIQGSDETIKVYKEVVEILIQKFASADVKECALPENLAALKKYTISVVNPSLKTLAFTDPKNRCDILESVLQNIFHSYVSVCDKQGRSHEMYQLLSQYPDKLLEKVLNKMRANSLIVRIKKNADSKVIDTGIQGVKLSQKYAYRFQSRFPSVIFEESVECLKELMSFNSTAGSAGKLEIDTLSKGGYCACYIGLFALGKLTFQTRIPKDIVILDPTLKQSVSRGQPYTPFKEQQEESDDDLADFDTGEDMSDTSSVTGSLIGQSKKLTVGSHVSRSPICQSMKEPNESEKTDLISRCSIGNRSIMEYQEQPKAERTKDLVTHASRALITMRRSKAEGIKNLKAYNVQDNFVINRCSLKVGIDVSDDRSVQEIKMEEISLEEANKPLGNSDVPLASSVNSDPSHLKQWKKLKQKKPEEESEYPDLTVQPSTVSNIVKRLTKTLPFQLDIDNEWENFDPLERQNLKQVYESIDCHGESGISIYQLKKQFNFSELLSPCLQCLEERNMIVKVGVTCVRYVSLKNVRPWAVHSYKNTRGRGTGLQPAGGTDSLTEHATDLQDNDVSTPGPSGDVSLSLISDETLDTIDMDQSTSSTTDPATSTQQTTMGDNSKTEHMNQGDNSSVETVKVRRGLRSATNKPQSSYPKPVSTYERIRLILVPWKKPEGVINKPVFRMMIESLMLYVMTCAGVHFNVICEKYSPYLQPFCIRELLEVLEELGCIEKIVFRKPAKPSLFSKPAEPLETVEDIYEDDDMYYEATADCVVRLGQFIEKL